MKSQSSKAIILGHKNIGEADKFVFLYTEKFGKIKAVAKGSRKITSRKTGHLETLNICEVQLYFGPRNIILTEINTLKSFRTIRENLRKLSNALRIAEITNHVIYENQHFENLLDLMEQTLIKLNRMENSSEMIEEITNNYLAELLYEVGMLPEPKSSLLETLETPSISSSLSSSVSNLSRLSKSNKKELV